MLELFLDSRLRAWWRALCVLMTVAVLWLALMPQPPRELDTGWDKANHLLAFASLTATAWLGWVAQGGWRWRAATVVGAQFALGVAIELLQTQVPGRSADLEDLVADALGIALGVLLAHRLADAGRARARR